MSARGWSSAGLKVVTADERLWTVTEAARLLGPPQLTVAQVRRKVLEAGIPPVGKRRTTERGRSGRYARVYSAKALIEVYETMSEAA